MTCHLVFLQNSFFKARRFKNNDEELKVAPKYYLHHVSTGYRKDTFTCGKDKFTYRKDKFTYRKVPMTKTLWTT